MDSHGRRPAGVHLHAGLTDPLRRLAEARSIPFRPEVLPTSNRFRSWDGLDLHYLKWGGGGPALVMLHGGALTAHTWDLAALALSDGFACVALDLRGHGDSGWSDDDRIDAHARDVMALLDHLGLERAHLAGMSLGGCAAGHAAALTPERIASLTFVDVGPQVNFGASAGMREFMGAVETVDRLEDVIAAAQAASPRSDPELIAYRYRTLMKASPEGFVFKQDRRRPRDFTHVLGKLAELADLAPAMACPALVARGGRSRILTDETAADFAGRFADGRWVVIPGAGHNVQEDNPVALAAAIAAMIRT